MFDDFFDPGGFFDFDFDGHTSMTEGLTGMFIMNECLNGGDTPDEDDYIDSKYGTEKKSVNDEKTDEPDEEADDEVDYDYDEFDLEEEEPYTYRTPYPKYEEKDLSFSESWEYVEPVKIEDTRWKKDYSSRFRSLSHKLGVRIENYSDEERFLGFFIPALCRKAPNAIEIIDQYAKYMSVSMKAYSKECEYYKAVMRASRDDDFFGNVIRASMLDTSYLGFKQSMNLANRTIYKSVNYVEESEYLKSLAKFTQRYNVLTKVSKTDPSKIRRKAANKILAIQYEGIYLPSYGNPDEAVASCEAVLEDVLPKNETAGEE